MKSLKELQKEKAIECLEKLKIYGKFIEEFKSKDIVSCFVGYNDNLVVLDDEEITQKIKEIEEKYKAKVYAVMINYTILGTYYDFLYVSQYIEEWEHILIAATEPNEFIVNSICWNKDKNLVNEFGTIMIEAQFGGIRRIG